MRGMKKFLVVLVMSLLMVGTISVVAEAKTVKTVTNWKKAKAVKKGTNIVKVSNPKSSKLGYIKFKAPKKGTYVFKFSNFVGQKGANGKDINCGFTNFYVKNRNYLSTIPIKFGGKKGYTLHTCSWDFFKDAYYNPNNANVESIYLEYPEAEVSFKLKKGQIIYLGNYFTTKKSSFKLVIKKK